MAEYRNVEQWLNAGRNLANIQRRVGRKIGDWLNDGEKFGEIVLQRGYELFDLHYRTLDNYRSICKRTPPEVRPAAGRVGVSILGRVAPLAAYPEAQKTILQAFADRQLDREGVEREVHNFRLDVGDPLPLKSRPREIGSFLLSAREMSVIAERLKEFPQPDKQYRVVVYEMPAKVQEARHA